ncbi:hypothetical protein FNV43_RR02631 [Rhamnella rubrinervis]|uniref:Integrator complex subunit 3 N-terminal domain-containing protein n=1 Tax=Rhamnella rubrinervis TaxID=2594499 RepID=A0A8K0MTU9_9ROSA|nr:hypothetical protein FNV43_RR02631 [Rhamnella rubrinervis]
MASKLIRTIPYEAENQTELSLRQAFEVLELRLRPTFPLTISNLQEYLQLNQVILYGVLGGPNSAKIHIKYLHAIVTDGYCSFVSFIKKVVNELYVKLIDSAKGQLIWVIQVMIDVSALGADNLLVSLLRQIVGGDFSDVLKEQFHLCLKIRRDLIRLLQDLVHVHAFGALWKDLVFNLKTLITDIVRFICCAHHPPNDIIQSEVIPRWAVIGWLLRYIDMTHTLLDFLFLLVDNYDVKRIVLVFKGSLRTLILKIVHSNVETLQNLISGCPVKDLHVVECYLVHQDYDTIDASFYDIDLLAG